MIGKTSSVLKSRSQLRWSSDYASGGLKALCRLTCFIKFSINDESLITKIRFWASSAIEYSHEYYEISLIFKEVFIL